MENSVENAQETIRESGHAAIAKKCQQAQSLNEVWTQEETEGPRSTGGCIVNSFSGPNDSSWANSSTPLHKAVFSGRDEATLLIENGANIDFLNALGRTALHEAAKYSRYEVASFLIREGANVNAETEARTVKDIHWGQRLGEANLTPLHEAIGVGNEKMVAILIEGEANVNHVSPGGWSPLDLALLDEQQPIIDILLAHGAQLISPEKSSKTRLVQKISYTDQRRSARNLIDCDRILPSSECRDTYLDLLSKLEHILAVEDTASSDTRSRTLVSTFHTLLYNMAERHDPCNDPSSKICSLCREFQTQTSSLHGEPFLHYPDRDMLTRSVLAGCPLCILFVDALDGERDDPKNRDSYVTLRIVCRSFDPYATRSIQVACAGRKGELKLYFVEGVLLFIWRDRLT